MNNTLEKSDIRRYIANFINLRLHQTNIINPHYSNINSHHIYPIYPTSVSNQQLRTFSRLRFGHTIFPHQWLLKQPTQPSTYNRYHLFQTIKHILIECPLYSNHRRKLFGNSSGFDLLWEPTSINIIKIHEFIIRTKQII